MRECVFVCVCVSGFVVVEVVVVSVAFVRSLCMIQCQKFDTISKSVVS